MKRLIVPILMFLTFALVALWGDLTYGFYIDGSLTVEDNATVANLATDGNVDGVDVSALKTDVDGFSDSLKNLTAHEIGELCNIGDVTTISDVQFGYLGALDQSLISSVSPTFAGLNLTGNIDMADDKWIGISNADERIVFDTAGTINLLGATTSFGDNNITNVGSIALATIASDADTSVNVDLGSDAGDDFTVDTDKLVVEGDTGNVGIGTVTPLSSLSVVSEAEGTYHSAIQLLENSGGESWFMGVNADGDFQMMDSGTSAAPDFFIQDVTGNVGIGTASPDRLLSLVGTRPQLELQTTEADATNKDFGISVQSRDTSEEDMSILFGSTGAGANQILYGGGFAGFNAATLHSFYTASAIDTEVGTLAMTIDSSGNVGIGYDTPSTKLFVKDDAASDYVSAFFNDGNNANRYGIRIDAGADDGSGTTYYLTGRDGSGDVIGHLQHSGDFEVVNASDARLKTDIRDTVKDGLEIINAIKVRDYNKLNADNMTGFVAQELQEVFPEAVSVLAPVKPLTITETLQGKEQEEPLLGIAKTRLIAPLVKAVQQLSDKVDQLQADKTALLNQNLTQQQQINDLITRVTALEKAQPKEPTP